jgi:hypothetical protein
MNRRQYLAPVTAARPALFHAGLPGGILIGMWNYRGWDNAFTTAGQGLDRQARSCEASINQRATPNPTARCG